MLKAQTTTINEIHLHMDNTRKCFLMIHKEVFCRAVVVQWGVSGAMSSHAAPSHCQTLLLLASAWQGRAWTPAHKDRLSFCQKVI